MKKRVKISFAIAVALCATLLFVACNKEKGDVSPCADGHSFEQEIVTEPTCTETGMARRVCTVCDTVREDELPAAGHKAGEWVVTLQPTCTEEGVRRADCITCGENISVELLPANGHTSVGDWVVDRAPTCKKDGERHTAACGVCGEIDVMEVIPALGHDPGEWQPVSTVTCTDAGVRQKICGRCKETVKSETIGALGHVFDAWRADGDNVLRVSRICARTGCDGEEEYVHDIAVTESGERAELQLSEYSLVYDSAVSDAFRQKITELASRIYGYTNVTVSASASAGAQKTIRIQTGSDASITGHGFAIKRSGDTVTVIGTTPMITQMGIDYFMRAYVTGETITLPALAVSDAYEMVDVSKYDVIYSALLDSRDQDADAGADDPDGYYGVSSETGRDFAVDVAFNVAQQLSVFAYPDSRSAANGETLIGRTYREQSAIALAYLKGHEYGIMMIDGHLVLTGYSVAAIHKAAPLLYDYLTDAKDASGRVLLPANLCMIGEASARWLTDESLLPQDLLLSSAEDDGEGVFQYLYRGQGVDKAAFDTYVAALKGKGYVALTESNAEGSYFVTLTDATRTKMIYVSFEAYAHASDNVAGSEWLYSDPAIRVRTACAHEGDGPKFEDVPKPSGFVKSTEVKTYESGMRQVYYLYYVKPTTLDAYRATLVAKGYTVILRDQATERFVAVNESTGERIEAFYAPCSIASGGTTYTHAICRNYYAPSAVRVPTSEILSPSQRYEKVTDTKIVAIDLSAVESEGVSGSYGAGYIIMLEDGRFVVIDGGSSDGGSSGSAAFAQVNNCWSIISALFKDVYGVEPTPSNPARIAAWIITHPHGDHMNMFWDFCHRYGGGEGAKTIGAYFSLEYLIANNADRTTLYNTGEPSVSLTQKLSAFNGYVKNGFTYIKAQTGQKFYFANLEIETLFTQADHSPQRIVTMNDASIVQRLSLVRTADTYKELRTVDHRNVAASSKTSFLSTGDAYRWSGRWMAAMFGTYLKTDMVSLSHHGGVGLTMEFYDLVSPRAVWIPNAKAKEGSQYAPAKDWAGRVNQHLLYDIDSVEYIYRSDDYHITLVLKESGPDYDGIYHATDKSAISYYIASKADLKTGSENELSARREMHAARCVAIKKI